MEITLRDNKDRHNPFVEQDCVCLLKSGPYENAETISGAYLLQHRIAICYHSDVFYSFLNLVGGKVKKEGPEL